MLKPSRAEDFAAGIAVKKKVRYQVKDLRMGPLSIKHLFEEIPHQVPASLRYYSGAKDTVLIRLRSGSALAELRDNALMRDDAVVDVFLEDDTDTFMRTFAAPWAEFSRVVRIPIVLTDTLSPCEELSRIVYRRIDDELELDQSMAGQTAEPIDLDDLFSRLLRDEIDPYIRKLDTPDRNSPCFRDFHLLQWIKNEAIAEFGFESYSLHPGLQSLLRGIAYSLTEDAWEDTNFAIDLTGYTDEIPFQKGETLPISPTSTVCLRNPRRAVALVEAFVTTPGGSPSRWAAMS